MEEKFWTVAGFVAGAALWYRRAVVLGASAKVGFAIARMITKKENAMPGIEKLKVLLDEVADVAVIAIKESKQFPAIVEEAKDLDTAEIITLVSQLIMTEVPKIVEAVKAEAPKA